MNVVIPPIFFYAVGTLFVVMGALRAIYLGRRRPGREIDEDTPERAKLRKRHLTFGIVYVLAGIFLILLTSGVIHKRPI
jgi:hypothetical protein